MAICGLPGSVIFFSTLFHHGHNFREKFIEHKMCSEFLYDFAPKNFRSVHKMSVRLSGWNNSDPTGRIFIKFDIWVFSENLPKKFKFHYNLTRITGTLHGDKHTFLIISRSLLLRMRNVADKFVKKTKAHILFSRTFFRKSCRCRTRKATYDSMRHAHCMLGT